MKMWQALLVVLLASPCPSCTPDTGVPACPPVEEVVYDCGTYRQAGNWLVDVVLTVYELDGPGGQVVDESSQQANGVATRIMHTGCSAILLGAPVLASDTDLHMDTSWKENYPGVLSSEAVYTGSCNLDECYLDGVIWVRYAETEETKHYLYHYDLSNWNRPPADEPFNEQAAMSLREDLHIHLEQLMETQW